MSLGRIIRYCILAYLGATYGRKIFAVVLAHGEMTLAVTIGIAAVAALGFVLARMRKKRETVAATR